MLILKVLHGPTALRVHVPNNWVLRILVLVTIVQVSGRYIIAMIIRYVDP